jgi:hypothetical protein
MHCVSRSGGRRGGKEYDLRLRDGGAARGRNQAAAACSPVGVPGQRGWKGWISCCTGSAGARRSRPAGGRARRGGDHQVETGEHGPQVWAGRYPAEGHTRVRGCHRTCGTICASSTTACRGWSGSSRSGSRRIISPPRDIPGPAADFGCAHRRYHPARLRLGSGPGDEELIALADAVGRCRREAGTAMRIRPSARMRLAGDASISARTSPPRKDRSRWAVRRSDLEAGIAAELSRRAEQSEAAAHYERHVLRGAGSEQVLTRGSTTAGEGRSISSTTTRTASTRR